MRGERETEGRRTSAKLGEKYMIRNHWQLWIRRFQFPAIEKDERWTVFQICYLCSAALTSRINHSAVHPFPQTRVRVNHIWAPTYTCIAWDVKFSHVIPPRVRIGFKNATQGFTLTQVFIQLKSSNLSSSFIPGKIKTPRCPSFLCIMHALQFLIFTVSRRDFIALGPAMQIIRKQSC